MTANHLTVRVNVAPWFSRWLESYLERALDPDERFVRFMLFLALEVDRS